MDKALKQRLVGASVLVALAVVILPMLLGGQPESPQDAQPIDIPPRPPEVAFETRRFPIGEQDPAQPSVVPDRPAPALETPDGADGSGGADASPPATLQERLEQVAAESAAASSSPPSTTDAAPGGVEAVDDAPAELATESAPPGQTPESGAIDDGAGEPEAAAAVAEAPVADAPPVEAPAPTVAAAPASGRYLVQVASFSSTANANRLAGTLGDSGLPVIMDTVDGAAGVLHRVRVGPFEQRAQAEQVVTRLGRQIPDVRPRVVDLRPNEESPVSEPDDPLIRWVVQVGVFSEAANAEKLVFDLRDAGYRASSQAEQSGGRTVYRVRVGPEVDRSAAVRLKDRLQAERGIEGIVQSTE